MKTDRRGAKALLFRRPTIPSERAAWLLAMTCLHLSAFVAERVPPIRAKIAAQIKHARREHRAMCAGCLHFPGEAKRRSEKPFGDTRICLAGHEMEFHIPDELHPPAHRWGWRRLDCAHRAAGEAPPEPALPPKPWFRLRRTGGSWYASIVERGSTYLRREVGVYPSKAAAREAARAWARRHGLEYVEELPGWRA